jgi:hypothetical protein
MKNKILSLLKKILFGVREEIVDNPYIDEKTRTTLWLPYTYASPECVGQHCYVADDETVIVSPDLASNPIGIYVGVCVDWKPDYLLVVHYAEHMVFFYQNQME